LGLHSQKIEIKPSTPEKSINTWEEVIQVKDEVTSEAKTDRYTACIMKETHTTEKEIVQYSLNPRKIEPQAKPATKPAPDKRSQPHNALATTIVIVIILPFVSTLTPKTRASTKISNTISVILPIISLRLHHKPNPPNSTIHGLPSTTTINNIPHAKHTEPSAKTWIKHITTSVGTIA
jgi:hypothetical protein